MEMNDLTRRKAVSKRGETSIEDQIFIQNYTKNNYCKYAFSIVVSRSNYKPIAIVQSAIYESNRSIRDLVY